MSAVWWVLSWRWAPVIGGRAVWEAATEVDAEPVPLSMVAFVHAETLIRTRFQVRRDDPEGERIGARPRLVTAAGDVQGKTRPLLTATEVSPMHKHSGAHRQSARLPDGAS